MYYTNGAAVLMLLAHRVAFDMVLVDAVKTI